MARMDARAQDALRPVEILPHINKFAEGSCLIRWGNTHVLCTASVEERTPPHVPDGEGWVTAEYSMLPGPTGSAAAGTSPSSSWRPGRRRSSGWWAGPSGPRWTAGSWGSGPSPSTAMYSRGGGTRTASVTGDTWPWPWRAGSSWRRGCSGDAADHPGCGGVRGHRGRCPPAGPVLRGGLRRHGGPQLRDDPGGGSGGAQGTGEGRAFTIQEQRQLVDLCAKGIQELLAIQAAVLEGGAL